MRGPSRQTASRLVAGASARAATARARSAMTSPSAPSATLASVSGRPAASDAAGDFAIRRHPAKWKSRRRRSIAVSLTGGTALTPVSQARRSLSSASNRRSNSSSSASLNAPICSVGKAAHDQVRLARAAMPGAEQNLAPARIQAFARSGAAGHRFLGECVTPKTRTGPGAGYIAGRTRYVRGRVTAARYPRCMNWRCARLCSTRCSPRSPAFRASGRRSRSCFAGCSAARTCRASSTSSSTCRPARSTAGRGRSCATWCPIPW